MRATPSAICKLHKLKIGGLAALGFCANLDVANGYGAAAHFHRDFSFRKQARMQGQIGW